MVTAMACILWTAFWFGIMMLVTEPNSGMHNVLWTVWFIGLLFLMAGGVGSAGGPNITDDYDGGDV